MFSGGSTDAGEDAGREDKLRQVFNSIDRDNNGRIDASEVEVGSSESLCKYFVESVEHPLPSQQCLSCATAKAPLGWLAGSSRPWQFTIPTQAVFCSWLWTSWASPRATITHASSWSNTTETGMARSHMKSSGGKALTMAGCSYGRPRSHFCLSAPYRVLSTSCSSKFTWAYGLWWLPDLNDSSPSGFSSVVRVRQELPISCLLGMSIPKRTAYGGYLTRWTVTRTASWTHRRFEGLQQARQGRHGRRKHCTVSWGCLAPEAPRDGVYIACCHLTGLGKSQELRHDFSIGPWRVASGGGGMSSVA